MTGDGSKVTGHQPVSGGRTRHLVLHRALAGESGRAISRSLGLNVKTVQEHLNRLLSERVLTKAGGRHVAGPAFAVEVAGTKGDGSDRPPPGPATGWGLMTSGLRTFTVLAAPEELPSKMPGFVGTKLSGAGKPERKRRNHRFRFTDNGRTHEVVLMETPTTGGWSLQYVRCSPPPRRMDLGDVADKELLWDRFTAEAAQVWARLAGVKLDPSPRRSRAVDLAFPGIMPAGVKWRRPNQDADDTPEPRTWEARKEELATFIETGADVQRAQGDALAELEQRVAHASARDDRLVAVALKLVGMHERGQEIQTATLRLMAPSSSPSLPPSPPGVDYA